MVHFSPRRILPLSSAYKYLAKQGRFIASVSHGLKYGSEVREYEMSEIDSFIPKRYRYPGYPLYTIVDKEYVGIGDNFFGLYEYMKEDDAMFIINKSPNVALLVPRTALPLDYQIALVIGQRHFRYVDLPKYFPGLDPKIAARTAKWILDGEVDPFRYFKP